MDHLIVKSMLEATKQNGKAPPFLIYEDKFVPVSEQKPLKESLAAAGYECGKCGWENTGCRHVQKLAHDALPKVQEIYDVQCNQEVED